VHFLASGRALVIVTPLCKDAWYGATVELAVIRSCTSRVYTTCRSNLCLCCFYLPCGRLFIF